MTTASLELCRELEELSEWFGTDWYYVDGHLKVEGPPVDLLRDDTVCAYDLGYLMRKLPNVAVGEDTDNSEDGRWYAKASDNLEFDASPEDALCKLAIELFKQGILKREPKQ